MRTVHDVLDFFERVDIGGLRYSIKNARAIQEWAVKSLNLGFAEGDTAEFNASLAEELVPSSGWYQYREAMAEGATCLVREIGFNEIYTYWYASVVLDREWSVWEHNGVVNRSWHGPVTETPKGYREPTPYDRDTYPEGRRHTFDIPVRHLRPRK